MVFASDKSAAACNEISEDCNFICVENNEQALNVLRNNEVKLVLVDMFHGSVCGDKKYLNIEDIDSASRDFFKFIREYHSELPVYLLECDDKCYSQEEKVSFMRHGVRGTLCVSKTEEFKNSIVDICESIHSQNSMRNLAKSNKLISYETAQILNSADKTAEIKLFDFKLSVAVDSEDSGNILSNLSKPDVTFDKVIGAEDAKKELKYFVEYLKNPKKYLGTGVHAPKGVLLYGPPGTGKTLLAKAMAGESDVTFITAEGNQFLKKYVGEGSEKVHELFKIARKYAPSILFVDEIDAIGKERRGGEQSGSEATLTAFLTEMDGFKSDPTKPVFVLAATNFDVEPGGNKSLDPALMRRFDRRVFIDLPKREDRVKYLNMKISKNKSFEISTAKFENIAVRST
ncbi:MAG: AAA family ATPase, partial [Acutalibacteraceae bacterium]|nr:AAA family ATPase [Acutalibacteraceae bacterium]